MGDWKPYAGPQTLFCQRGEYEVLFGGAKGPGKTDCLIASATRRVEHPQYRGVIIRRTYPRLEEIIDRCHNLYPRLGGEWKSQESRWTFPSGAKIKLSHMQHEQDKYNFHGKEFHFVGFDELTEFLESQYLFVIANIRRAYAGLPLRVRATTNPGGIGHVWVKRRFVDVCPIKKTVPYMGDDNKMHTMGIPSVYVDPKTGTSRCFVPATVYDNPAIMVNDPGYVQRLESLPKIERMRLLHGEWDVFEGQVFQELTQTKHGCDPFEIPPDWKKVMAFDWGYAKPWVALWFAVDYDGVMYLYRELYGGQKGEPDKGLRQTNMEIARAIVAAEREKVNFRVADPACWSPTKIKGSNKVHGPSFVEDASKEGLFFMKADNDRLRGKQQCHMRFAMDEIVDSETGEVVEEHPMFVAFNNCANWWRTMAQLREDPKNPEDVDTDQEDHCYDTTRYAFMSRPIVPKRFNKIPPGSFAAERNRLLNAKKYARRHGVSLAAAYARVR